MFEVGRFNINASPSNHYAVSDADAIKGRPGVHSVVRFGGADIEEGVAVVADSYWHAKSALDSLREIARERIRVR